MQTLTGVPLQVVGPNQTAPIQLLLSDKTPILLGEGKFAIIFLGANPNLRGSGDLIAIKFLKRDPSAAVTGNSIYRFCQEVHGTALAMSKELNSVVGFRGYGRIGEMPPEKSRDLQLMLEGFTTELPAKPEDQAHSIFGSKTLDDVNKIFKSNKADFDSAFAQRFTGDFYALNLCVMSLEELLLGRGDVFEQSSASATEKSGVTDSPLLQNRALDRQRLKDLKLKFSDGASGFEDIEVAMKWVSEHPGNRKFSDAGLRYRNAIMFDISVKCLAVLGEMHQNRVDDAKPERGFAHRDIKPANILIDATGALRLSDLGFIASVTDIRSANFTAMSSLDEGGVLPLGSRGFRAPEQNNAGEEVSFSVDASDRTSIVVHSHYDTEIEQGDFIKISGVFKESQASLARIRKPEATAAGDIRCSLPDTVPGSQNHVKGRLIKDVSLHSDLYSLGCVAYFIGSEGRNPERFMRTFVDVAARKSVGPDLPPWVLDSPLWFAAVMCQDKPEVVLDNVERAISAQFESSKPSKIFKAEHNRVKAALDPFRLRYLSDELKIASWRANLKKNSSFLEPLQGKVTKLPVSFPQLYFALMCCMRETNAGIVIRDKQVFSEDGKTFSTVFAKEAHLFVGRIQGRLSGQEDGSSIHFGGTLLRFGQSLTETLMRLRLASERLPPASQSQQGEEACITTYLKGSSTQGPASSPSDI